MAVSEIQLLSQTASKFSQDTIMTEHPARRQNVEEQTRHWSVVPRRWGNLTGIWKQKDVFPVASHQRNLTAYVRDLGVKNRPHQVLDQWDTHNRQDFGATSYCPNPNPSGLQQNLNGKISANEYFAGEVTNVHMWDEVLSPWNIATISNMCSRVGGNIINWETLVAMLKYRIGFTAIIVESCSSVVRLEHEPSLIEDVPGINKKACVLRIPDESDRLPSVLHQKVTTSLLLDIPAEETSADFDDSHNVPDVVQPQLLGANGHRAVKGEGNQQPDQAVSRGYQQNQAEGADWYDLQHGEREVEGADSVY
eukprot:gi/632986151/ref/XP_007910076.1/ PREDICTED: uncharacterized protein LOC103190957 [Callorhinchus milii]